MESTCTGQYQTKPIPIPLKNEGIDLIIHLNEGVAREVSLGYPSSFYNEFQDYKEDVIFLIYFNYKCAMFNTLYYYILLISAPKRENS